jgi:raffinose/stachyose/melibiose transport system substrate-binding protein
MQGKTAMMANGPWMVPDFLNKEKSLPDFDKKVGVAAYPGSGVFASFQEGYMICSKDKEHADAAFEFLKFKTGAYAQQLALENDGIMPLTDKVKITDEFKVKNPLVVETIEAGLKAKNKYQFFDIISYANVIDTFSKVYPELAYNKVTAEQMAKKLSDAAAKNK